MTAPAEPTATATQGSPEPRPGHHFTRIQRILIVIVVALVLVIAAIGFAGSYAAVTRLAAQEGFGPFAKVFPIGVDSGIGAFLALDLLLTWLRIPFPMLRYGAWALTAATIAFNAAAAWPDPLGVGMHAVIPLLFVIAVEAARHAVGRIADITADKHIELPPMRRWIVAPWPTFRLWRRQIVWQIRSYDEVIVIERQRQVYRARLRAKHGRKWRSTASADELLALRLATRSGMTIADALALPENEARARQDEADARQLQAEAEAADRARTVREEHEAAERAELARREEEEEAARRRLLADAETDARLAEIRRAEQAAAAQEERRQEEARLAYAQQMTEQEERRRNAARDAAEQAERARREKERAAAVEAASRAANASANAASGSSTGSAGSPRVGSQRPAATSASAGNSQRASRPASASDGLITTEQVVAAYQQLTAELNKAPSDSALGQHLGVSRSRAQQLRTQAIDEGHTDLAKPLRVA